jgi:hypothetical protein
MSEEGPGTGQQSWPGGHWSSEVQNEAPWAAAGAGARLAATASKLQSATRSRTRGQRPIANREAKPESLGMTEASLNILIIA